MNPSSQKKQTKTNSQASCSLHQKKSQKEGGFNHAFKQSLTMKKKSPILTLHVKNHVASVCIHTPNKSVNVINQTFINEIDGILTACEQRPLEAIVFYSTVPGVFITGADITEFLDFKAADDVVKKISLTQQLWNRIGALPAVTVALLQGTTLGGGCELALACDHIVVSDADTVNIGLPEVRLGIIPGWGGCTRLPKRIGLANSLGLILTGKSINGKKAQRMGLADAMVPNEFALSATIQLIRNGKLKQKPAIPIIERVPGIPALIAHQAKKKLKKQTQGHYPAPLKALSVIKKAFNKPVSVGLALEATAEGELFGSAVTNQLIHCFFGQDHLKKQAKKHPHNGRTAHHVGVCGAGLMGGGIGTWFLQHGHHVRLFDISQDMLHKGLQTAQKHISKLKKRKKIQRHHAQQLMDKLSSSTRLDGFKNCELVIEAVPEVLNLKQSIYQQLESVVRNDCIIASNTSSLCIDTLASALKTPERFCGIHFFSPVQRMPLVEVIPSKHTHPAIVGDVCRQIVAQKKFPVVVKNCPGFLVNRILLPYVNEACHMVVEGIPIDIIDSVATNYGMPIGPLALSDEVGLDVGLKVLQVLHNAYGERVQPPSQLDAMASNNHLGKKTGKGFYVHGKKSKPNVALLQTMEITQQNKKTIDRQQVEDRLICVMINEAARCLEESIVADAQVLDMAMVMGIGFVFLISFLLGGQSVPGFLAPVR